MRRPLLIVVIVVAAIVIIEIGFRLIAPALPEPSRWYSGWAETKAGLIENVEVPPEVVFLGDSSTMNGLNPNQFADGSSYEAVFNAGIPAVTPMMIEDWYRRVVEPASDPKLVLIGLTTHTVTMRDPGPYFESIAIDDGWLGSLNRWLYEHSWTVRYRGVARDPVGIARHISGTGDDHWDLLNNDGWFTPPDREYGPPDDEHGDEATIVPKDREALISLVRHIQDSGADVVFVRMPETADRADTYLEGVSAIHQIKAEVDQIARRLSVPIADLSEISSTEWFTDSLHLDPGGSRLAGDLLIEKLDDLGQLADRPRTSSVASSR